MTRYALIILLFIIYSCNSIVDKQSTESMKKVFKLESPNILIGKWQLDSNNISKLAAIYDRKKLNESYLILDSNFIFTGYNIPDVAVSAMGEPISESAIDLKGEWYLSKNIQYNNLEFRTRQISSPSEPNIERNIYGELNLKHKVLILRIMPGDPDNDIGLNYIKTVSSVIH